MSKNHLSYTWPLILAYHSISLHRKDSLAVKTVDFERQIAWLHKNKFKSITLADFASKNYKKGDRIVIVTFDDGYEDNFTQAFPILKKYGFVATVFLVSDYVNTDHIFYWDIPRISDERARPFFKIMNWEQVNEMADYGIEFGSHTCTHPELTKIASDKCWMEINQSRIDLKNKLGRDIISFCYPRGNLNNNIIGMVDRAGYSCAVVSPPRWGIPLNQHTLRRIGLYYQNSFNTFRLKIHPLIKRNHERLMWFHSH